MQEHEGFSLPEVISGILFCAQEYHGTLLVCLRSFLKIFFMLKKDLGTLTGCKGMRAV